MIQIDVQNAEKCLRKLEGISGAFDNAEKLVLKGAEVLRTGCVMNCPVNDGALRQSIMVKSEHDGDTISGVVYTNLKYAPYVEFGTGPKGAANHSGISPNISPSYTMEEWWIHESQLSESAKANYSWQTFTTPEGTFYKSSGQAAQPFMYRGSKQMEPHAQRLMADYASKIVKEKSQ